MAGKNAGREKTARLTGSVGRTSFRRRGDAEHLESLFFSYASSSPANARVNSRPKWQAEYKKALARVKISL